MHASFLTFIQFYLILFNFSATFGTNDYSFIEMFYTWSPTYHTSRLPSMFLAYPFSLVCWIFLIFPPLYIWVSQGSVLELFPQFLPVILPSHSLLNVTSKTDNSYTYFSGSHSSLEIHICISNLLVCFIRGWMYNMHLKLNKAQAEFAYPIETKTLRHHFILFSYP